MKKIFLILALSIAVIGVRAQQSTNTSSGATTTLTDSKDKQCHGVTKDCPILCTHDQTSASMSSTHENAGAAPAAEKSSKKSKHKKNDAADMDCCKGHTNGTCNMDMSKSSGEKSSSDNQMKDSTTPSNNNSPK